MLNSRSRIVYDHLSTSNHHHHRLSKALEFPIPTMTFPHNSLEIRRLCDGFTLSSNTKEILMHISRHPPRDIRLPDSENVFWRQKSAALGCAMEYDWTYWSEHQGTLMDGKERSWEDTELLIDYERLASQSETVRFFESMDLYEDELADNGICSSDQRFVLTIYKFPIL